MSYKQTVVQTMHCGVTNHALRNLPEIALSWLQDE